MVAVRKWKLKHDTTNGSQNTGVDNSNRDIQVYISANVRVPRRAMVSDGEFHAT